MFIVLAFELLSIVPLSVFKKVGPLSNLKITLSTINKNQYIYTKLKIKLKEIMHRQ